MSWSADAAERMRVESEKDYSQMSLDYGAPGTQAMRAAWTKTFEAFLTQVLNHPLDQVPNVEMICRFFLAYPKTMKSTYANRDAIAYSTVCNGWSVIKDYLSMRFPTTYAWTKPDQKRLIAAFETLIKNGHVTRSPARDRQWIVATLLRTMVANYLEHCLQFGTKDWTGTIAKVFSLVFQSALCARAGDHNSPDNQVRFHLQVELAYNKNNKANPDKSPSVVLTSLEDPTHNCVCAVKLFIVLALRLGSVHDATTLQDMIENARKSHGGVVPWAFPNRPLLLAFDQGGHVDITKPAGVSQLKKSLNEIALTAGIMEKLSSHDIRRGAANDVSRLNTAFDVNRAAEAMNHGHAAITNGTTRRYMGTNPVANYQDRLALEPSPFQLQPIAVPAKRKRAVPTSAVVDYMHDPANAVALAKVREPRRLARATLRRSTAVGNIHKLRNEYELPATPLRQQTENELNCQSLPSADTTSSDAGDPDESEVTSAVSNTGNENIDPRLLLLTDLVTGHVRGSEEDTVRDMESLQMMLPSAEPSQDESVLRKLIAPPQDFLEFFSTINVFASHRSRLSDMPSELLTGGSRDLPTRFRHACKNKDAGCPLTFERAPELDVHETTCTPERVAALREAAAAAFQLTCKVTGCDAVVRGKTQQAAKTALVRHMDGCHPDPTQQVTCPDCDKSFPTKQHLAAHTKSSHDVTWTPIACPLEGPGHRKKGLYTSRARLMEHLRRGHSIVGEAAIKIVGPTVKSQQKKPRAAKRSGNTLASVMQAVDSVQDAAIEDAADEDAVVDDATSELPILEPMVDTYSAESAAHEEVRIEEPMLELLGLTATEEVRIEEPMLELLGLL